MYRIIFPLPYQQATLPHPLSLREGAGGGARDRAGQENSSGLCTSQVSLTLNLLAKNRLGVCKTPILLRKTALLAASIKLPDKLLPARPARPPSRLPARSAPSMRGLSRLRRGWEVSLLRYSLFTIHSSLFTLHYSLFPLPPSPSVSPEKITFPPCLFPAAMVK